MDQLSIDTHTAYRHFQTADPHLAQLLLHSLSQPSPLIIPTPQPPEQYFASVISSILSQQISTKAAAAVKSRVVTCLGEISVAAVRSVDFDTLKQCGLSTQKTRYVKHNAEVWHTIDHERFPTLLDEEIIQALTLLYGVGRWTAEMFLMFSLARPDVFSTGDLGLMSSLYEQYPNIRPHHTKKIRTLIESWSPHRTTAALVLWYHRDNGPVLP